MDGPPSFRLGFIGAPVSTLISYYTISILTIVCLVFKSPAVRSDDTTGLEGEPAFFDGVPKLLSAGLAGIGGLDSTF